MGWITDIVGRRSPANIQKSARDPKPKAWNWNPSEFAQSISSLTEIYSGLHPGTLGMDYATLYTASRVAVIGAIIGTRVSQIAEFASPQKSRYGTGYRIRLRDFHDKRSPTKAQRGMMRDITRMIEDAGGDVTRGYTRGFEAFVRALMRDSFTYDQANFEIIRSRGATHTVNGVARRKILGFVPVDATTMRRARPKAKDYNSGQYGYNEGVKYVQMVDNQKRATFTDEEMSWCVRRPRTWLSVAGYGYPELEELTRTVTDLLNATTYNSVNFSNGIHASTILAVKSSMDQQVFEAFQRNIHAMMYGVHNAKRAAVVQLDPEFNEDIQNISLTQSNREMEYGDWINFLLKIVCAVYLMDPAEIGFVYGNEGGGQTMNGAGPEQRIVHSKERGLRPTLRQLESWINRSIVYEYDPDFEFEFVGIDAVTEAQQLELDSKAVRTFKTVNQVRAEHDLDPLDHPLADLILDGTYISSAVQLMMYEKGQQQAQEQADQQAQDEMREQGLAEEDLEGVDLNDIDAVTEALLAGTEKSLKDGRTSGLGVDPMSTKRDPDSVLVMRKSAGRNFILEV